MGLVGASLSPHCPPASRLLPRVTSVHLPDFAHCHTIGPGMFPSSQIPSWKVCASPPSPLLPLPPLMALCSPIFCPTTLFLTPLCLSLPHSAFLPIEPLSLRKFPPGRTRKQQADLREKRPRGAEMGEAPHNEPCLSWFRWWTQTGPVRFCAAGGPCGVSPLPGAGSYCPPRLVPRTLPSGPLLGHGNRAMIHTVGWLIPCFISKVNADLFFSLICVLSKCVCLNTKTKF